MRTKMILYLTTTLMKASLMGLPCQVGSVFSHQLEREGINLR